MRTEQNAELIPYLAAIVDSADDAIIAKDLNGIITTWNHAAETIFGYSAEEAIGKPVTMLAVAQVADEMPRILDRIRNGEKIAHFETIRRHKDGREIPISLTVSPIKNANGEIIGACKIVRDISERRRMDNQLKNSLAQSQVLLQEVHHRVKNNLNIIAALLSMQAHALEDAATVAKLQDSERRVMSMAMIHEQLYLSQDMSSVDLAEYVKELTTQLFALFVQSGGITYQLDTVPTPLTMDQAIPCGLILNELITNSLKYAYPSGHGEILIRVWSDAHSVSLTVSDHGVGMPRQFDISESKSLGMRIIQLLTRQLDGVLAVGRESGTSFTVSFAADHPDALAKRNPQSACMATATA